MKYPYKDLRRFGFFVFCVDTHSWNNCWEYLDLEISTFTICIKLGFKFD